MCGWVLSATVAPLVPFGLIYKTNRVPQVVVVARTAMSALPVTELPSPIGTPATAAITTQLRGLLNRLLGWTSDTFPGGQPSSLTRATLGQLVEKSYFVCEKADGVRYLLLATRAGCFLVDQKYDFWKVDLHFPLRPDRVDPATNCLVHHFTLVDAELVMVKGDLKPKLLMPNCFLKYLL